MASESIDLFGCPYCGFRVRPSDESCPRCGNAFKDGTKFECPFCGDMVNPGVQECPSCHINFEEFQVHAQKTVSADSIDSLLMDIIKLESSQVKKEEKKFSCPKCSWMLDGSEDRCPKCEADLAENATLQCPVCGTFVSPSTPTCPECGTLFASEDVPEEKLEEDHEAISSALTDILSSAGHEGPLPEIEKPSPEPEPEPVEEPPPAPPELVIERPRKKTVAPVPEPVPEPESEPEPEPLQGEPPAPMKPAAASSGPKKAKQRKLKAKPGAPKPSK